MFLSPARAEHVAKVEYPGLPLQPDQIRLIRLLPGAWPEPVRCQLSNVPRSTAEYQTLSYVWGSRKVTRTIVVNNKPYPSTVNLESALRHLRERNQHGITLWVDALCINQDDTAERTRQVQLMGHIYKLCDKVNVYLGDRLDGVNRIDKFSPAIVQFDQVAGSQQFSHVLEGANECTRQDTDMVAVFRLIQDMSNNVHLHGIPDLVLDTLARKYSWAGSVTHESADDGKSETLHARAQTWQEQKQQRTQLIENLRKLMHPPFTPWWNRIWVIQEIAAPRTVDIVYGGCAASWDMFTSAARNFTKHSTHCCASAYMRLPRDLRKVLEDFSQRVTGIDELRTAHNAFSRRTREPKPRNRSLLELLRKFRDRKASDPRDKVFALLSLVEPEEGNSTAPMLPDYALTESWVFLQATLQCIYASRSLSVFSTELGRKFRDDLPSWVPDWGAPGGYTYAVRAHAVELYDACPSDRRIEELVYLADASRLGVRGFEFEKIQHTGDTMWGDDARFCCDTLANWWRLASNAKFNPTTCDVDVDFWKLICGDVMSRPQADYIVRRARPRDELHFVAWSYYSPRSPFRDKPEHVHDTLWSMSAKLFRWLLLLWPHRTVYALGRHPGYQEDFFPRWQPRDEMINWNGQQVILDEQAMIMRLLHAVNLHETVDVTDLINVAGHFSRDGPWRTLYETATQWLCDEYGFDDPAKIYSTDEDVAMIDSSIMAATLSRRLIVGEYQIGLGPADARVQDELCFLEGGKTPFVVRRRENEGERGLDQVAYEIVGDCYVQDLMDDGPAQFGRSWRDLTLG